MTTHRIHEFLLIPGVGHFGPGAYDRGHVMGNLIEVDLVDKYVATMADELDQSAIRHRICATRKAPGLSQEARFKDCFEYVLPVQCRIGWSHAKKIKPIHNQTTVYYGTDVPSAFAAELVDIIRHWGSIYVTHGHKAAAPVPTDGLRGISIEPFFLNGPNAPDYCRWLDKLGRDLGRYLADYARSRQESAVFAMNRGPGPKNRVLL